MNYFIAALPRSRTAWLAEFMTHGESYCFHEAMANCSTHAEVMNKLSGYKHVGNSDSGLMFFPIKKYYPDSPVLIVERDLDEICDSLEKIGLFNDNAYRFLVECKRLLDKMDGRRVDFHAMNYKEIWEYLVGDGYDSERADRLDKINVQHINYNADIRSMNSLIGETQCLG